MAQPYDTAVKYNVLEKSLLGNEIFEAGQTAMWDGHPGSNLEPTCEEGHARVQVALGLRKEHIEQLQRDYQPIGGLDPDAFLRAFRKELDESQARQAQVIAEAISNAFERLVAPGAKRGAKVADTNIA